MPEEKEKNGTDTPKAKSSKKLLFIIIGVVVLMILGGGGFFVWSRMDANKDTEKTDGGKEEEVAGKENKESMLGVFFAMEPFIVNLQDNDGTRYLKLLVYLELEDEKAVEEARERIALIRDSIIILLSSKSYSDVGNIQGKYQLRDEITVRINQILTKRKVKAVYFTEFVIQ